VRLCREWYNDFRGLKLDEGLDSTFSYQAVLQPPVLSENPKKAD
jgi:hypothetical protein